MFKINEVYDSIQGEGPETGKVCTFVRLQGCNVCCPWCDTTGAMSLEGGTTLDMRRLECTSKELIVFTGGEPLLQFSKDPSLAEFMLRTLSLHAHKKLSLETSGTVEFENWEDWGTLDFWFNTVVISPKRHAYVSTCIEDYIRYSSQDAYFKFVVSEESDIDWIRKCVHLHSIQEDHVYLQPCSTDEDMTKLAFETCLEYNYNMSIQTHKFINVR